MSVVYKAEGKEMPHKHYPGIHKVVSVDGMVNKSDSTYTRLLGVNNQINGWQVPGARFLAIDWSGSLRISKGRGLRGSIW